jgi:subtilisin family serine protease
MARKDRRARVRPRVESLEARALMTVGTGPLASGPWAAVEPVKAATTLLVRFASTASSDQINNDLAPFGGRVVTTYPDGPSVVALPPWADTGADLSLLKGDAGVVYAEADATFHASGVQASGGPVTPNNPGYSQEWGMSLVDAPAAWGVTTGTPSTIVAVLDTGLDMSNPAFLGRIWTNPNPNGSDGYRGDLHGWNFISNNSNLNDDDGHGTHVTGILAATGNNGIGVAGMNWGARIMPLKVLDSQGNGTTDASISGVYFAVNHGAKVINASWGGDSFSQAMLDALNYANAHGVVFVTAAGNETSNNDVTTTYPASYRTPNELVVAAVNETGGLADYSNWGVSTVDLAAPGSDIYSTVPHGFDTYSGTSMATPFVSGTVALLSGANPGLNAAQLVARVKATVKPDPQLNGLMQSPGVVDPYYALVNHVTVGAPPPPTGPVLVSGGSSLEDVEAGLLISDGIYNLEGGTTSSYVSAIYKAIDGRAPSSSELSYHVLAIQNGESRFGLVRGLQNSTEGLRTRVARWYQDVLVAPQSLDALKADPGVAAWAARLASGSSDADVLAAMLSSDARYNGLGGNDAAFISSLYLGVLGRAPDPGGVGYHVTEMAYGVARSDEVRRFLASPEGHAVTVARLYRDDLGSTTPVAQLETDNGVQHWAGYLGSD